MFKTLAYAKLNLSFNRDIFIKEYDDVILSYAKPITNSLSSIKETQELNRKWNMIPPELYDTGDYFEQPGDTLSYRHVERDRKQWMMTQLMELDILNVDNPLMQRLASFGGTSLRNETLDDKYKFKIKPEFENLQIWKWINDNLPMQKINSVHCVSIDEGGMATIHRDRKGLYDSDSSAGINKVYNEGYVVITLNISNGGVPLYWALDGKDIEYVRTSDDDVYLTNDYFVHGVPICTFRRRQVRVTGIPKPELYDIINKSNMVDFGPNYKFEPDSP
jgi:hypothetical protein